MTILTLPDHRAAKTDCAERVGSKRLVHEIRDVKFLNFTVCHLSKAGSFGGIRRLDGQFLFSLWLPPLATTNPARSQMFQAYWKRGEVALQSPEGSHKRSASVY